MNIKRNLTYDTDRKRSHTRTQQSASKRTLRGYELSNNIYSRQNTYMTVQSNSNNSGKVRSKLRSMSSKSLFEGAKSGSFHSKSGKLKTKDFHIPTTISKQNWGNKEPSTSKYQNISNILKQMLNEKLNKKPQLHIKSKTQDFEGIHQIVNETEKMFLSKAKNYLFEQRKSYLQKSCGNQNLINLIQQYVQTQQSQISRKQKMKKLVKIREYSMEIPNPFSEIAKKQKAIAGEVSFRSKRDVTAYFQKSSTEQIQKNAQKQGNKYDYQGQHQNIPQIGIIQEAKIKLSRQQSSQAQIKSEGGSKKIKKPKAQANQNANKNSYVSKDEVNLDQIQEIKMENSNNAVLNPKEQKKPEVKIQAGRSSLNSKETKQQKIYNTKLQKKQSIKKENEVQTSSNTNTQQIKSKLQQDLKEAQRVTDFITPVGEVAGFCSQTLKKTKLNWFPAVLLLYKQCCDKFKQYEDIYIKAAEMGIISHEEKEKYVNDNEIIQKNLEKVISMGKKKNKLSEECERLVENSQSGNLLSFIQKQVLNFGISVITSDEKTNPNLMMCLLRMTNAIKILAELKGFKLKSNPKIEEVNPSEVQSLVMKDLQQISLKKINL